MTEEQVTILLINYLKTNNWEIICFDYPQSGTGRSIKPLNKKGEKNLGSIIPDIIAIKNQIVILMENKDRFVLEDFKKINYIKNTDVYEKNIIKFLKNYYFHKILYGIGIPNNKEHVEQAILHKKLVDFIFTVSKEKTKIIFNNTKLNIFQ